MQPTIDQLKDIPYPLTPASEIADRIARLQAKLGAAGLDGALIVQNVDLHYFSGTMQNAHLYVPAAGEAALFVWKSLTRARHESPLRDVVALRSPRDLPKLLTERGYKPAHIGLELDVLAVNQFRSYERAFENVAFSDCWPLIRSVRLIKSAWEVAQIERAGEISSAQISAVLNALHPGVTELEAAAAGEYAGRVLGHEYAVRMRGLNNDLDVGYASSGPSGAYATAMLTCNGGLGLSPSHAQGASWRRIQRGEPVLADFVGLYNGYLADQTRTLSIGPLPDDLQRAYAATRQIHDAMVAALRPGNTAEDVYNIGVGLAGELGYAENIQGYGEQQVNFIGHGVGLELNEWPAIARSVTEPLQPGMVIALEPKLAFPAVGMVGIENTWLVTRDQPRRLTTLPEELACVPA
jgi:Xaa-Pro dipeptidase